MNPSSEQSMTTEELRELTHAPLVDEPLVTPADFEPDDHSSIRPIWKMPLPKLGVIAILLVPVFGLAGYFLVGGQQADVTEQPQSSTQSKTADSDTNEQSAAELDQLRQENEALKANSALDGQAHALSEQSAPEPRGQTEAISTHSDSPTPVSPRPQSQGRSNAPAVINASPASSPAHSATASRSINPPRSPTQFSDPAEQWAVLGPVGQLWFPGGTR